MSAERTMGDVESKVAGPGSWDLALPAGPRSAWKGRHIVICNWRDSVHPKSGGAELYCEEVARNLKEVGVRVTLLTSRPNGAKRREEADFGTIVRAGGTLSTYILSLAWLFMHRGDVDGVIDSQNGIPYFSPLVLPRRTAVSLLIHHVHQEQFKVYFPWPISSIGQVLEKRVSKWVYGKRAVCVVSPSSRASVRSELSFKGPVYVTPCGLESGPEPAGADSAGRSRSERPTITYLGRLVGHKRIDILVQSIARICPIMPEVELHLVGDGEDRVRLESLARDLGIGDRVIFHGRVSDDERDRLLSRSWITATASMGEGWGLSIMEAAALGVPAVAFRVPGLQDSIQDRLTGWLVESDAAFGDALIDALESVSDPVEANAWANRCRIWAKKFSWATTTERLLSVLTSERDRLKLTDLDRRHRGDATTVVEMARSSFDPATLSRLRRTDQARFDGDQVHLLVGGADEQDAHRAVERAGVRSADVVKFRVARHGDLIGWDLDAGSVAELNLLDHVGQDRGTSVSAKGAGASVPTLDLRITDGEGRLGGAP